jgi:hypothetical protein
VSQLIACHWAGGLVMAADRRVETRRDGVRDVHTVRKLFPLGPEAAVATSGAAVGIWVSRVLSRLFRRRGALPLPELEDYSLAVFQKEYSQFVQQGARWFAAHPEAHRRSYVLLGGRRDNGGYRFRFHASEDHGDPYHPLGAARVLTAPRRLGLEGRLARAARAEATEGDAVVDLVLAGLRHIAAHDEAVAAPFDVVSLTARGTRWQLFDEPPPAPRVHVLDA